MASKSSTESPPTLFPDSCGIPKPTKAQLTPTNSMASTSSAALPHDDCTETKLRTDHISIVSLEDDDDDGNCSSSVADSDSDLDDLSVNLSTLVANAATKTGSAIHSAGMIVINNGTPAEVVKSGGTTVLTAGSNRPQIGSIAMQNSSDITFGDKTFYHGTVTVKKLFLDKDQKHVEELEATTETTISDDIASDSAKSAKHTTQSRTKDKPDLGTRIDVPETSSFSESKKLDNFWKKLLRLERRPLEMTVLASVILLFVGMFSIVTCLLIQNIAKAPPEHISSQLYVERVEWLAKPSHSHIDDLDLPATSVIISHTATDNCVTNAECRFIVRSIQMFQMQSNGWDDIGYNFLVGGDGFIYIGRGWDKEGNHTRGFNSKAIGIAFIGTFMDEPPPSDQILAGQRLIEDGLLLGKIIPFYKLYGQRQLVATESPGAAFYPVIKSWSHWANTTQGIVAK